MSRSLVYTLHLWPPLGHAAHYTGKAESSRFLKAAGLLYGSEFGELAAWVRPSDGSVGHEGPERVEVRFGWQPVGRAVGEPGQGELGRQVLLAGRGLAGVGERPQVTDHSQRHAAPRLQESRTRLSIAEDCTGMPTRIQISASAASARLSCHLTCDKGRRAAARTRTNCRQVQHTTPERRLAQRLTDHALGRGARLTQVQIERGGSWVLAQTQPGGRALERRLKQHGATRRCEVCKAAGAYQSGELTAPEALARAGWDRSNPVQRSLLLDIFGIPKPPEMPAAAAAEAAAVEPAAVTAGQPSAAPRPEVPAPRAELPVVWLWPGRRAPAPDPELDPVVDALIARWRSPEADAQPQPQPAAHSPPEPVLETGL